MRQEVVNLFCNNKKIINPINNSVYVDTERKQRRSTVMVSAPTMYRCQGANLCCIFSRHEDEESSSLAQPEILQILAFDVAKTMCRLVSLYKSLSDTEIIKLRRHIIRSKGVAYLNSKQEYFLLNLACAERFEDLDLAAACVSRLGRNCIEARLRGFDMVYEEMKNGFVDIKKLEYGTKGIEKDIEKMERLISSTRDLHMSMESLVEMEATEKKIQRWRSVRSNHGLKVKVECFNDRIAYHRRQVQQYKQNSLWNQTFNKVVSLMSRIICIVYARLSSAFGSLITRCIKSNRNLENSYCLFMHRELYITNNALFQQKEEPFKKRPKGHALKKTGAVRFPNRPEVVTVNHIGDKNKAVAKTNKVFRLAPPTTVGGAGLSHRYSTLILFTERCMRAATAIGQEARMALFDMLPEKLKMKVKERLRSQLLKWEEKKEGSRSERHSAVAAQSRKTVEEVMGWLSPVAQDTVRWQAERNLEKQKFDTKPTVLLLQTLHYSDLEKVEGAIVELLVGLSCIYWYQKEW